MMTKLLNLVGDPIYIALFKKGYFYIYIYIYIALFKKGYFRSHNPKYWKF